MSKMQLTDAQQRAAVTRAHVNVALTSGAGCGKTAVLAHRFTQLLLTQPDQDDPLAGLVALTFTDKAALEMRQRLAELLAELAAESSGDDLLKLRRWSEKLPEARVMTIHSFCAALLRTHAIAAGVDPGFSVLADELVTAQMIVDAAEQAVLAAVESGDRAAAEVVEALGFAQTVREVGGLVSDRLGCDLADYADPQATLARWRRRVEQQARAAWGALDNDADLAAELKELTEAPCSDPADKLGLWRDEKLAVAADIINDPAARTVENFAAIDKGPGNIGSKASWGGAEQVKAMRSRLKSFTERLCTWVIFTEKLNELDTRAAGVLACLTALARRANERFAAAKRAKGVLDFVDLLDRAAELLAKDHGLRSRISGQIGQMLIDECQDTNAFQLDMLVGLASDGRAECPPGKLCLIGDTKQSIYRFRGAQVEVFDRLCDRLGPGARESLDISFRTHAAGVAFINALFAPLMGESYEAICAHRRQAPPQPSVEIILAGARDDEEIDSAATARQAQAAALAQRIREIIDDRPLVVWDRDSEKFRPARYGDIAVLFARMTYSLDYERELAARGVPYYVVAGTGFFRQQEIYDLLNALRVIDDPFDDTALIGLLRSSLFGLDDNALMHLAQSTDQPYALNFRPERLSDRLAPDDLAAMSAAVAMVGRLHRQKDSLGIAALLETVTAETGCLACHISRPHGGRRIGNVRMLIDRARSAWREGMTLSSFISQMNTYTLNQSRYEQAAVAGEEGNVVRLMTVHKAKGLEFPVVFVPDLNWAAGNSYTSRLLRRADWGLTCSLPGDEESDVQADKPLSHRLAMLREKTDDEAETIRKYYVAVTRHMDHLVLVGADRRDKHGKLKSAHSFIRQMDDVLAISQAIGDDGRGELRYGDDYIAACRRLTPTTPRKRRSQAPPGKAMLAEAGDAADLLARIAAWSDPDAPVPPLLGPLPTDVGRAELAVTALGDFAACPMLYRWRHELRVPPRALPDATAASTASCDDGRRSSADRPAVDPATAGTFFHRCVELLDFTRPQPSAALAQLAAEEMSLPADHAAALAEELAEMIARFGEHELWRRVAQADPTLRELKFLLTVGPATLRGQIDLLFRDSAGAWCVVDYKSDRLADDSPAGLADHSSHHRLQMLTYAVAAGRHLRAPAPPATLYYLRSAATHTFTFDEASLAAGENELAVLAESLIASRRSGQFEMRRSATCDFCPYGALCGRC